MCHVSVCGLSLASRPLTFRFLAPHSVIQVVSHLIAATSKVLFWRRPVWCPVAPQWDSSFSEGRKDVVCDAVRSVLDTLADPRNVPWIIIAFIIVIPPRTRCASTAGTAALCLCVPGVDV